MDATVEQAKAEQCQEGSNPVPASISLRELQFDQIKWREKNFPGSKTHEPALGVGEEVGEMAGHLVEHVCAQFGSFLLLAKSIGKLQHHQLKAEQGIRYTPDEIKNFLEDDAADIVIYLADFCTRHNIDLESAVARTWDKVSKRDWQKNKTDADKKVEESANQQQSQDDKAKQLMEHYEATSPQPKAEITHVDFAFTGSPPCALCNTPISKDAVYGIKGVQNLGAFFHELCAKKVIQHAPSFNKPPAGIAHDKIKECPSCGGAVPQTYKSCQHCGHNF